MHTDAEALLLAGTNLAADTWCETKRVLGWSNDNVQKVVTHQVGRAHRKLLFERLGLDPSLDLPTVEYLGNTGAAALPTALSLAAEQNRIQSGDHVALLGIGSGLNALMLGVEW